MEEKKKEIRKKRHRKRNEMKGMEKEKRLG